MRILLVQPWFRSLAHIYGRLLSEMGHEPLVVTTTRHPEPGPALVAELPWEKPTFPRSVVSLRGIRRQIRAFSPDLVMIDVVDDPLWLGLGPKVPHVLMVHDATPHDANHVKRGGRGLTPALQRGRAAGVLVFSDDVRTEILRSGFAGRQLADNQWIHKVPLLSDLPDEHHCRPTGRRRDFLVIGRTSQYKGTDIAIAAWRQVRSSGQFAAEQLVVVGGDPGYGSATAGIHVQPGPYAYRDVLPSLGQYRAALLPYREASQSGVQLLALQNYLPTLVTAVGALPEYQPPSLPPINPEDPAALAAAMLDLADAGTAAQRGEESRRFYVDKCSPVTVTAALTALLEAAT